MSNRWSTFRGVVRDAETSSRLVGARVLLKGFRRGGVVATHEAFTDKDGRFSVSLSGFDSKDQEVRPSTFQVEVWLADTRLQLSQGPLRFRASQVPQDADIKVNLPSESTLFDDPVAAPGSSPSVRGWIRLDDGTGIGNIRVRVFKQQLGGAVEVPGPSFDLRTDPQGAYELGSSDIQAGPPWDLFIRVVDDSATPEAILAVSSLVFNATNSMRIDAVVSSKVWTPQSDYAVITAALEAPQALGVSSGWSNSTFTALTADDVAWLAGKVKQPIKQVADYVAGWKLKAKVGLSDAEVGYALVRGLGTAVPAWVLHQDHTVIESAIEEAAATHAVKAQVGADAVALAATLQNQRDLAVFDENVSRSIGSLLAALSLDTDQKGVVMTALRDHPRDRAAFWAALRADSNTTGVTDQIQRRVQGAVLSLNHAAMVDLIETQLGSQPLSSLVGWTQSTWRTHIDTSGFPDGLAGSTDSEKKDTYAKIMVEMVELAFPSEKAISTLKAAATGDLSTFLDDPDAFDFRTSHIDSTTIAHLSGLADPDQLVLDLRALQRAFRLAPRIGRGDAMEALVGQGMTSAGKIVRKGKERFRTAMGGILGSVDAADAIFNKAVRVHGAAATLWINHATWGTTPKVPALISPPSEESETGIPEYDALFGTAMGCRCQACLSMFSPAGYFIELMSFIDARGGLDDLTGTTGRRQDLASLKLTCPTTYTEMPYIDLVLELLENRPEARGSEPAVDHDETTLESPVLMAGPEYFNAATYTNLALAYSAPGLPYDLWRDRSVTFLRHLGLHRAAFMEALQRRNTGGADFPSNSHRKNEVLGLNTKARDIITGADAVDPWLLWSYDSTNPGGAGSWTVQIRVVSAMKLRGALTVDEILDLCHAAPFDGNSLSWPSTESCDLDEISLSLTGTAGPVLTYWARFIRLVRATDWTVLDLRCVLDSLAASDITGLSFDKVADVVRLCIRGGMPPRQAAGMFADLDTFADRDTRERPIPTAYDQVFVPPSLLPTNQDSPFRVGGTGWGGSLTADHYPHLQAVLQVGDEDLADAIAWAEEDLSVSPLLLSVEHLSALYRRARLAQILSLTVADAWAEAQLNGLDPFVGPSEVMVHLDAADRFASTRLSMRDLRVLAAFDGVGANSPPVSDGTIQTVLGTIRDDLRARAGTWADLSTEAKDAARSASLLLIGETLGLDATVLAAAQSLAWVVEKSDTTDTSGSSDFTDAWISAHFFDSWASAGDWQDIAREVSTDVELEVPFGMMVKLSWISWVIDTLGLSADVAVWWLENTVLGATSWTKRFQTPNPLVHLPNRVLALSSTDAQSNAAAWIELALVARFLDRIDGESPSEVDILGAIHTGVHSATATALSLRTGWSEPVVGDLLTNTSFGYAASGTDPQDAVEWNRLLDAIHLVLKSGASVGEAFTWAKDNLTQDAADAAIAAARRQYTSEDAWLPVAQTLRDPIRARRRDALVGLLVPNLGLKDADGLYEHLLIDVSMEPCFPTSRMVQAIASLQQYIQRWLLGLEVPSGAAALGRDDKREWAWKKNYRVWEAALKIFMYPENWVEPELRGEASTAFRTLQKTLGRGELTEERVEEAVVDYLENMADMGDLRVLSVYPYDDDGTEVLHMVARTRAEPPQYFYRNCTDQARWTYWEPIDGGIQGNHVSMLWHHERLYLFWMEFEEASTDEGEDVDAETVVTRDKEYGDGTRYWEITLAWCERKNGKWSPVRRADTPLATDLEGTILMAARFTKGRHWMRSYEGEEGPTVEVWVRRTGVSLGLEPRLVATQIGAFVIDLCTLRVETQQRTVTYDSGDATGEDFQATLFEEIPGFKNAGPQYQGFHFYDSADSLRVPLASDPYDGGSYSDLTLFNALPTRPDVIVPDTQGDFVGQTPFVFQAATDSFLIRPVEWANTYSALEDSASFVVSEPPELDIGPTLGVPFDTLFGAVDADLAPTVKIFEMAPAFVTSGRVFDLMGLDLNGPAYRTGIAQFSTADAVKVSLQGFNEASFDEAGSSAVIDVVVSRQPTVYSVQRLSHPYVCDFVKAVRKDGVWGLFDPDDDIAYGASPPDGGTLARQQLSANDFWSTYHGHADHLDATLANKEIRFENADPWGIYHWELFYHLPVYVAKRLRMDGRYDQALRWLESIFDPTNQNTDYAHPQRYWRIKPFLETAEDVTDQWAALVGSGAEEGALDNFLAQIDGWLKDPFDPHEIARLRPMAYQRAAFMAYLDTLIAWGDELFRRDTRESVAEATQLYVQAKHLLGDRPERLPTTQASSAVTWATLSADPESALDAVEGSFAGWVDDGATSGAELLDLPAAMAFCLPYNDKLLTYWDTLADRLFKVRNCLDLDGNYRRLPLFQPPIDPALLVQASALGLDIDAILSATAVELPHYRFTAMLDRAKGFTGSVRSLGSALLQALEKQDGETVAQLRAEHEVTLLAAGKEIRRQRIEEAKRSVASLRRTLQAATARRDYYEGLLDVGLIDQEREALAATRTAGILSTTSGGMRSLAGVLGLVPQLHIGPMPASETGGRDWANVLNSAASAVDATASWHNTLASINSTMASNARRKQDWVFQRRQVGFELLRIEQDLLAAQIRQAIAEHELEQYALQIDQATAVRDWMQDKYTNEALYEWMVGELASLYYDSYELALGVARKVERCLQWEQATSETFLAATYWDGLREGLLAGDKLHHDLERMERAYLDADQREFELTKHISLDEVDPVALLKLRTEGSCSFSTSEVLFDLDFPGHYLRRIKSVAVSVPCVGGGYLNLSASLRVVDLEVRASPSTTADLEADSTRGGGNIPSEICTSTGQQDSGLFETNLSDPRYLPFERRGVIGGWTLTLTSPYPNWDPKSIADAVLHIRYTARDGSTIADGEEDFGTNVRAGIATDWNALESAGSTEEGPRRAFLLSRDFPDEWAALFEVGTTAPEHTTTLTLPPERWPKGLVDAGATIDRVEVLLVLSDGTTYTSPSGGWLSVSLDDGSPQSLKLDPSDSVSPVTGVPFANWAPSSDVDPDLEVTLSIDKDDVTTDIGFVTSPDKDLDPTKLVDIVLIFRFSIP